MVVPVHLSGHPCDLEAIHNLSKEYGLYILEDAAHAIGSTFKGDKIGSSRFSDITVLPFIQ